MPRAVLGARILVVVGLVFHAVTMELLLFSCISPSWSGGCARRGDVGEGLTRGSFVYYGTSATPARAQVQMGPWVAGVANVDSFQVVVNGSTTTVLTTAMCGKGARGSKTDWIAQDARELVERSRCGAPGASRSGSTDADPPQRRLRATWTLACINYGPVLWAIARSLKAFHLRWDFCRAPSSTFPAT
jgi:hypothetical protein